MRGSCVAHTRHALHARRNCTPASYKCLTHAPQTRPFTRHNPFTTPHPLSPPSEWAVNQHRDSYASHLGHQDLLSYFAVVQNEAIGRARFNMMERMVQPCGPAPAVKPAAEG